MKKQNTDNSNRVVSERNKMTTANKSMIWQSEIELEGGARIILEMKLAVGSMYPTQWGDRKVVACRLVPVGEHKPDCPPYC